MQAKAIYRSYKPRPILCSYNIYYLLQYTCYRYKQSIYQTQEGGSPNSPTTMGRHSPPPPPESVPLKPWRMGRFLANYNGDLTLFCPIPFKLAKSQNPGEKSQNPGECPKTLAKSRKTEHPAVSLMFGQSEARTRFQRTGVR